MTQHYKPGGQSDRKVLLSLEAASPGQMSVGLVLLRPLRRAFRWHAPPCASLALLCAGHPGVSPRENTHGIGSASRLYDLIWSHLPL